MNFIGNSISVFDQGLAKQGACSAERGVPERISNFAFRKSYWLKKGDKIPAEVYEQICQSRANLYYVYPGGAAFDPEREINSDLVLGGVTEESVGE